MVVINVYFIDDNINLNDINGKWMPLMDAIIRNN